MGRILDQIRKFIEDEFDADGLEPNDGDDAIMFRYVDDDDREWGCLAIGDDQSEQLMFYSVWSERVPEARRRDVMEFVTRANYGLPVGNFEMDLDDGEVRVKTAIDVDGIELTPQLCGNLVDANLAVMDRYFDGLDRVINAQATPAAAIEHVEADDDDDDDD